MTAAVTSMLEIVTTRCESGDGFALAWSSRDESLCDETLRALHHFIPSSARRYDGRAHHWIVNVNALEGLRKFLDFMIDSHGAKVVGSAGEAV